MPKSQKGVTLVELMVVVAVVAVLATALVVQFGGSIRRAEDARVIMLVDQIAKAATAFEAWYGHPPPLGRLGSEEAWDRTVYHLRDFVSLPPWQSVASMFRYRWFFWVSVPAFGELSHYSFLISAHPPYHDSPLFVGTSGGVYRCDWHYYRCREVR
jgi:prepilin-type N-terminal cleavage/methylation domain-containing protein